MTVPALIITHDDLAEVLLRTTGHFAETGNNIRCFSNQKEEIEAIVQHSVSFIRECAADTVFIFTDLVGGSCWQAGLRIRREIPGAVVIGGVNLPMLISFVAYRSKMESNALKNKIIEDAQKAIRVIS